MKISIVIPCRNEVKYIEECIEAIYNCDLPTEATIQTFVVDGMSNDGTRELVQKLTERFANLRLVDNEKQLTPFAFNLGIYAGGVVDYVQIVGARHILSKNYLQECLKTLIDKPDVWCVGGNIINEYVNETGEIISKAMSTQFGMGLGNFRTLEKSGYTDTVTSPMYPYWVFEKIGFFDEELIRNQDDDFNFRVEKEGGKIYYEHEISLKYYVRGDYNGLWRQFFQYGYWKVYVNRKHKAVTTWRQLIPPIFVLYILSVPFAANLLNETLGRIYSTPFAIYLGIALLTSVRLTETLSETLSMIWTYIILHLSYGFGYWKGIFHFLLFRRKPSKRQKRLSR
ncbi:MAG: glycosyltransferase family 2 protein [Crocinitomicaceae bacterium]|nr:glycosyltransferase family 2 protein [Crocinitomicaceae bacterium]